MRLVKRLQRALREEKVKFGTGDELDEMARILDEAAGMSAIYEAVIADVGGKKVLGQVGLSAEQIVKLGILRKRLGLTYRGLAEATADSLSVRRFLDLEIGKVLKRSSIHGNLKRVQESTWAKLNECLTAYAVKQGYEDGKSLRADTTTVETNIHYPTDASLLSDSVRVLCRNMSRGRELVGKIIEFTDHRRRAKGKLYQINNAHGEERRHPHYLELIRVTRKTVAHAEQVLPLLKRFQSDDLSTALAVMCLAQELETYYSGG